jgi:hypothetical protein
MITRKVAIDKARKALVQKQQSEKRVPVVVIQKGGPVQDVAYVVVVTNRKVPESRME